MKVFACLALALVAASANPLSNEIPGEYLVVMRQGYKLSQISNLLQGATVVVDSASFIHFRHMTLEVASRLERSPLVSSVEVNRMVYLDDPIMPEGDRLDINNMHAQKRDGSIDACETQGMLNFMWNWQAIRTSHRNHPVWVLANYEFGHLGAGTFIYVIDTGIHLAHSEFAGGRAQHIFTADEHLDEPAGDNHGHGTHVAGLAGGLLTGLAQEATLLDCKVLGGVGGGSTASVTAGVDAAWEDSISRGSYTRSVINLSLGNYAPSPAMRAAVNRAIDNGVFVVVAAGNTNEDAVGFVPAGFPEVISVGAVDRDDAWATFTNWGPMVDVGAPGVAVVSAFINLAPLCDDQPFDDCFATNSGTSMSSPVVAGIIARYIGAMSELEFSQQTQVSIEAWVIDNATEGVLHMTQPGQNYSANRNLFLLDC